MANRQIDLFYNIKKLDGISNIVDNIVGHDELMGVILINKCS